MFHYTIVLLVLLTAGWTKEIPKLKTPHNQNDLVSNLQREGHIDSKKVARIMKMVDRKHYFKTNPYMEAPERNGFSALVRTPQMVAKALEVLKHHLMPGYTVLDYSCCGGYMTACMALMVKRTGRVVAILDKGDNKSFPEKHIRIDNPLLLTKNRITFLEYPSDFTEHQHGPYNAIYFGTQVDQLPLNLWKKLKVGGRLLIPMRIKPDGPLRMFALDKTRFGNATRNIYIDDSNEIDFLPKGEPEQFQLIFNRTFFQ